MSHPLRGFCFLTASCREVILLGVHRIPCWLLRAASRLLPSVTISAHAVNTLIILFAARRLPAVMPFGSGGSDLPAQSRPFSETPIRCLTLTRSKFILNELSGHIPYDCG